MKSLALVKFKAGGDRGRSSKDSRTGKDRTPREARGNTGHATFSGKMGRCFKGPSPKPASRFLYYCQLNGRIGN